MNNNYLFLCDICNINNKSLKTAFDVAQKESLNISILVVYNKTSLYFGDYGNQASPLQDIEKDILDKFNQHCIIKQNQFDKLINLTESINVFFIHHDASMTHYIEQYSNWLFEHKSLATRLNPGGLINKLKSKKHEVKVIAKNGKVIDLKSDNFFNYSLIQSNRLFWDDSPMDLGVL